MPESLSVEDLIRREAEKAEIPVELALAVAQQESSFNPTLTGPAIPGRAERAIGTFQLLPSTASTLGVDPQDPVQNVQGGVKYLRQLLDQHEGDLQKVLATYGGVKRNTTYVPEVLQRIRTFTPGQPPPSTPSTVRTAAIPGLLHRGTVDLSAQPTIRNRDGSRSTVDSVSFNVKGQEVLLPTVMPDGRHLSPDEAMREYQKTGKHLGIFDTPENATAYAKQLHDEYAAGKYTRPGTPPPPSMLSSLVRDVGPYVLPTVGSIAGGAAGFALGGPPGAFAGSVTGSVLGEKAQIEAERLVGMPPKQAELVRLGMAAAGGMAGEGLGQVAAKVARPFASKMTAEGYAAYRALKGQVTPAQITESRLLDVLENIAGGSLFGGGRVKSFKDAQQVAINQLVEETVGKVGTRASAEEAGQAFVQGLEGNIDRFHQAGRRLYAEVDRLTNGAAVPTASLKQFANDELTRVGTVPALIGDANRPLLEQMANLPDVIPFEQAQYIRSRLLARGRSFTDPDKAVTRGIADQLTGRVDTAMEDAAKAISPEAEQTFRAASAFWREGKDQFETKFLTRLAEKDPSKIIDTIMANRAAPEMIRATRRAVDDTAWKALQGAAAQRLATAATSTEGSVSGKAMLQQLKNLGRPAARELFGDQTDDLYNLASVMQAVQKVQGEGTGRLFIQVGQGRGVIQAAGAAFGASGNLGVAIPLLVGPELLARVLTHPKGAKWLSLGLQVGPKQQQALRALGNLLAGGTRAAMQPEELGEPTPFSPMPGLDERLGQPPPTRP